MIPRRPSTDDPAELDGVDLEAVAALADDESTSGRSGQREVDGSTVPVRPLDGDVADHRPIGGVEGQVDAQRVGEVDAVEPRVAGQDLAEEPVERPPLVDGAEVDLEADPAAHEAYRFFADQYIATYPRVQDLIQATTRHVARR